MSVEYVNDFIVISGGDGTLNYFVNNTDGMDYNLEFFITPTETETILRKNRINVKTHMENLDN